MILVYIYQRFILTKIIQQLNMQQGDPSISTPQETFEMIECGNLDLNFPIERAILLLGQTKAGKTTTSHFLARQLLIGVKNDVGNIIFKIQAGDSKFSKAHIGIKEHKSETQIPNIFPNSILNPPVYLVDCPGYLDTYGCSRVLSNGFFHYKIFSQVKQLKFILTIQYSDLDGVALNLRNTFKAFYDSFTNYASKSSDILGALSLMVTKVPSNIQKDFVENRLKNVNPWAKGNMKQVFEAFKSSIMTPNAQGKNRLFIFKGAREAELSDQQNRKLEQINSVTQFWKHDIKDIKISIKDKVLRMRSDDEDFYEELQEIGQYFKSTLKMKLHDFFQISASFIEATFQGFDFDSQYLRKINQYVQKQVVTRQDKKKSKYFEYEEKRKDTRDRMLRDILNTSTNRSSSNIQVPSWIRKIEIVDGLYKRIQFLTKRDDTYAYTTEGIDDYSITIKTLIQEIIKLNRQSMSPNSYIMKFGYDIISLLNIATSFYEIFYVEGAPIEFNSPLGFILTDFSYILKDIIDNLMPDSAFVKKIKFFQTNNLLKPPFFTNHKQFQPIKDFIVNLQNQIHMKKQNDANLELREIKSNVEEATQQQGKGVEQFEEYLSNVLSQLEMHSCQTRIRILGHDGQNIPEIKEITFTLQSIRSKFEKEIFSGKLSSTNKMRIMRANCINMLAEALSKIGKRESDLLALELYDFTCNAHRIMEFYSKKESQYKLKNQLGDQYIKMLIQYSTKARKYGRMETAFAKIQEATHLAILENDEKLLMILNNYSEKIVAENGELNMQNFSFSEYSKKQFPQSLEKRIKNMFK